jgi:thiol-disulfide isomerase/thioredoxin
VLIDFWTYTCINCIRTLPYVESWQQRYGDEGLTIVGVHSPEFPFEKDAGNVADAIRDSGLTYPVVQDNDLATWDAWQNQYWPAKFLVDAEGNVRYLHFGEGSYDETEQAIRTLLREAGDKQLGGSARATGESIDPGTTTPETYLGADRARGWANGVISVGDHEYGAQPGTLAPNVFAYSGDWDVGADGATSGDGAQIDAQFDARDVFLVMGADDGPRSVQVLLDGKPIPAKLAGEDVKRGRASIDEERLYRLVELPAAGSHRLSLIFDEGIEGYAFTFG